MPCPITERDVRLPADLTSALDKKYVPRRAHGSAHGGVHGGVHGRADPMPTLPLPTTVPDDVVVADHRLLVSPTARDPSVLPVRISLNGRPEAPCVYASLRAQSRPQKSEA